MNTKNLLSTKRRLNLRWLVMKMIWQERGCRHVTLITHLELLFFILKGVVVFISFLQAENEYHRTRNQELVEMQEDSAIRQEQARRATEEQIQAQRRQTEREKAEIERETIKVKAIAEAEGRAHEARLAEDVNRRMLVDRANAEREKWVAAINTTFDHIGGARFYSIHDVSVV